MKSFFAILYNYIFLIELVAALAIITVRLKKREHFWIRALVCILLMTAASSVWNGPASVNLHLPTVIFRYIILYTLALISVYVLFDASCFTILFCGTAAYAFQHFAYRAGEIGKKLFLLAQAEMAEELPIKVEAECLSIGIVCIIYILYGIFGAKKLTTDENICRRNKKMISINFLTIVIVTGLSTVFNRYQKQVILPVWFICSLYAVLGSLTILIALHVISRNDNLEVEKETLGKMLQMKGEQYQISKETIDIINIKCHDMKHRIRRFQDKMNEDEIKELEQAIEIYDMTVQTGNQALDILLTEKGLLCQNKKIRFTCIADGKLLSFMEDTDIYSLFGNALDNCIRAVEHLPEEKRVIDFSVKEVSGMVSIHFENWYDGELIFEEDLPKTTKEDENYHGFGMKSIRRTVEKYDGYMKITAKDHVFRLNLSFTM